MTQQNLEAQQVQSHQLTSPTTAHEFGSVEELLREDARQTTVPPALVQRLQESVSQLPGAARRPWWRRLFGGSDL